MGCRLYGCTHYKPSQEDDGARRQSRQLVLLPAEQSHDKVLLRTSRQVTVPLLQAWIGQSRRHDPVCLSVVVLSYIAGYPPFFFEGGRASTTTAMTLVRPLSVWFGRTSHSGKYSYDCSQ